MARTGDAARDRAPRGFTLVELLVVIAIISILAAIVVPQVGDWVSRARMARAISEIRNIELALTKMLSDTNKKSFRHFFTDESLQNFDSLALDNLAEATRVYNSLFYILLRRGRNGTEELQGSTGLILRQDVLGRLGGSYMELGADPWGNPYRFWMGPLRDRDPDTGDIVPVPLRSWRPGQELADEYDPYVYDTDTRNNESQRIPGSPPVETPLGPGGRLEREDAEKIGAYGFPAEKQLPVYVWSQGEDLLSNQVLDRAAHDRLEDEFKGGGDDINNWDNGEGWVHFYN